MTGFSSVMYSCKISQNHAFFLYLEIERLYSEQPGEKNLPYLQQYCTSARLGQAMQAAEALLPPAPSARSPSLVPSAPLPAACCSVFGPLVLEELQIHAFLWTSKALWLAVNASTYCTCLKIAPHHPLGLSLHSWCWFSYDFFLPWCMQWPNLTCFLFTERFTELLLPCVCCHLLCRSDLPVFCPAWNQEQNTEWDQPCICQKK